MAEHTTDKVQLSLMSVLSCKIILFKDKLLMELYFFFIRD